MNKQRLQVVDYDNADELNTFTIFFIDRAQGIVPLGQDVLVHHFASTHIKTS